MEDIAWEANELPNVYMQSLRARLQHFDKDFECDTAGAMGSDS